MKYKIIGLLLCCFILLIGIFVPSLVSKDKRFEQHIDSKEKAECLCDSKLCSNLPLVEINTNGNEIPGKPIYDAETSNLTGYTVSTDGEATIDAEMKVIDNYGKYNHPDDNAAIVSKIKINVRGNSSRSFDKSSYALRLVDVNGENNSQSIMGMDAHHEWALYGPYLDKSLIRNYMWYNIAGNIMDYAPNVRFCEVYVNSEYQGLYVMCETITSGNDGARLPLSIDKKNNTFSGYLLRLDNTDEDSLSVVDTFTHYTLRNKLNLEIKYPGYTNLTSEIANGITQDFSDFEKSLYSYDYDDNKRGYKKYIDVDSFVDYFIINEFTCNYDAGWLSTYIYKDIDSKYRMCVWDFNSCCDMFQYETDTQHFEMQNRLWYFMLIKDEEFTERIIERYRELRKTYLSTEYLNDYIDSSEAYIADAAIRNFEKWGYTFNEEYDLPKPAERNPRSREQAISQLKEFISERASWMDENIETLRQYSSEARIKKFNDNAN